MKLLLKVLLDVSLRSCIFILLVTIVSCSKKSSSGDDRPRSPGNPDTTKKIVQIDLYQADPAIFEENGTFYLYGTNDENANEGFRVYTSKDLKTWEGPKGYRSGYALSKIENYGNGGFWAPQVWKMNDKYFMAYTADEHIAISTSTSPTGPFTQSPQSNLFSGTQKQIDPFVFFDDSGTFIFYVDIKNGNKIFVTELASDLKSVKVAEGTECIRSTESWENNGQPSALVTEGPTVIKHKGFYYLIYSANHFENPNYAVGYATSENLTGPWIKYENNPILSRNQVGWSGTGHGDLILNEKGEVYKDKDGKMYYVFHTHYSEGGARKTPRKTALIKMYFESAENGPDILKIDKNSFEHLLVNQS